MPYIKSLRKNDIRARVLQVRGKLITLGACYYDVPLVDIVRTIERWPGLNTIVLTVEEMTPIYGLSGHGKILLREDIYDKACNNDPDARFYLAHELGHQILHEDFYSTSPDQAFAITEAMHDNKSNIIDIVEWQADWFAYELLMPMNMIANMTEEEIVDSCGVSNIAARVRMSAIPPN